VHRFTQQALVPLSSALIQVVAASQPDGTPNPETIAAFRVPTGQGICMQPGCWHTTRVLEADEVTCLLLTRRSTTVDLIAHFTTGSVARESAIHYFEEGMPTLKV